MRHDTFGWIVSRENNIGGFRRQMASKMDPKMVKIQGSVKIVFLHPLSIENLVFEVQGPPKSDQKSFKNVI